MRNLADIRKEYTSQSLDILDVDSNPLIQFSKWMNEALEADVNEPTAMNLATVNNQNKPSARIVLLKGIENNSFVFFTNYHSHKGKDIEQKPYAALTFFWPELERQVRIEGSVTKVDPNYSTDYFQSRPIASQIGAIASLQSQTLKDRNELEEKIKELNTLFIGKEKIERPEHWGGYALSPESIEFWQGRASRLHDRIHYKLENNNWLIERLYP
ncbi:MAG: pyridoxamine 5'-phosphate oxidase [Cytophagaceae bacterium]